MSVVAMPHPIEYKTDTQEFDTHTNYVRLDESPTTSDFDIWLSDYLNKAGKDGWELVEYHIHDRGLPSQLKERFDQYWFLFKRQVPKLVRE